MLEKIYNNKKLYALIVRSKYKKKKGISFFTDKNSTQQSSDSGRYYLTVYNTNIYDDVNFNIAYGDSNGSGSVPFNANIAGKSPSSTVYGQFQNIVTGDENTDFIFGNIIDWANFKKINIFNKNNS